MLKHILAFELRQQFSNPVFWVVATVFALLGFGASSSDAVQMGGGIGNTMRNAPYVIVQLFGGMTSPAMLLVVIFIGASALRDFDNRTAELFFTTPVKKRDYLFGRFGGGFIAMAAVMLAVAIGMAAGPFMPWVDQARIGPMSPVPYLWALFVLVLPNLVFIGALLFCLAVATRSMLVTYIGVIAFFAFNAVTGVLTADLDARWIGALLDPFGVEAINVATRYWSTAERNTLLPPLDGTLLANRLIWLGASAVFLWLAYKLFRTDREGISLRRKRGAAVPGGTASAGSHGGIVLPKARLQTSAGAQWRQFLHQAWFDMKGVFTSVPLLVMLLLGLMILVINLIFGSQMYGTTLYPTTSTMSTLILGSYAIFLVIVVTFYAGELVWRERSQRISEVTDAFPNADWIPLAAKLVALSGVIVAFWSTGILVAIVNQLARGYTHIEPGLYVTRMLIGCTPFVLMGVVALFFQVVSNNKFIGYALMLVYLVVNAVMGMLDFEDYLYRPMQAPGVPYSDMNGYGHFLVNWGWFRLYWTAFAGALFIAAMLLWVRGNRSTWNERVREARRRLTAGPAVALAACLVAFVGIGAWIFHNTHVLNDYLPEDDQLDLQAEYETTYSKFKGLAQPRITAMRTHVDIDPAQRIATIRGHYTLVNKHAEAIPELVVLVPGGIEETALAIDTAPHTVTTNDTRLNTMVLALDTPLAPGASIDFDMVLQQPGFPNNRAQTQVVENGTFFNSFQFPQFGYSTSYQITDRNERRKRDLGEVPRMASIDDEAARANTYISDDADWIDFETTVSTAEDQIALAPGYLQREWVENGRRYFHYTMDVPMLNFAAWLSARWDVKKGDWNGMPIEIYYHPAHHWNVDRMIEASKKSFDYFNTNFTPYQHKQLRILEFPAYASFAQAFANTVPYSEAIGFVADLRDPEDIDYVFYVTAHEVAHQWWAHRVIGADVQGSTMLSESLAQYSALMVMEKEYGPHRMRKFLKYELDGYLRARATELREELPLALVENQQYIHYQKGSLVFYALRDAIGEDTLNAILKRFLEEKGFQQPPYTTSRELLAMIREGTDPSFHPLIEDLFEKIVFYDNRTVTATAKKRDDGKYAVTLKLHTAKLEAEGKGEEKDVPLDQQIDVGIFARPAGGKESDETVLHFARHRFTDKETTLELAVDGEPYDAGVDPYNKLIDRDSNDNRMRVTVE